MYVAFDIIKKDINIINIHQRKGCDITLIRLNINSGC